MTRKLLALLLCAALFPAAQYSITLPAPLNAGDTLTLIAPGATVPPVTPPVTPAAKTPMGVNLPGMDDWNAGARAKIFVDVMKTARCIQGAVGADGWPTGASKWRVLTTSNNQAQELNWSTSGSRQPKIAGTYLLSFEGASNVTAAGASIRNITSSNGKTLAEVVITSDSNDVDLNFSNAVRSVVLLRPGYPRGTTQFVTNEFKAYVAPFTTIRYMDAMATNWADEFDAAERFKSLGADKKLDWAERAPDTYATYNRPWGLSIEGAIRIANDTKCNPWIPIPWCATDNFVSGLAAYVKANLDPSLVFYFEWGNENPWNSAYGFYHSSLVVSEAKAYVASGALPKLDDPAENEWYLGARWVFMRTVNASEIFRAQFGADFDKRIIPIVASQYANPSYVGNSANWVLRKYPNHLSYYIKGFSFAPYIGASDGTVDQLLAKLNTDIANRQSFMNNLAKWRGMADAYKVKLYLYESGVDVGQGVNNITNRIALGYDPRMQSTIDAYLRSCYNTAGAESLMWFNAICTRDKWGIWGLTDDAVDLTQPMYKAASLFVSQSNPGGGVMATFCKDTNFTTVLSTHPVPLINHYWQAWDTGPIYGRKDLSTTQVQDGSIRFVGRYLGAGTLSVEKEANDVATLTTQADGKFQIDYKAIFGGNGSAAIRLMETINGVKTIVPPSRLTN